MCLHRIKGGRVYWEDHTTSDLRRHAEERAQLQLPPGAHPEHRVRHHSRPPLQPHHLPLHKLHEHHRLHEDPQRQGVQGHRRRSERHVPHRRPAHAPGLHHYPRHDIRGRHHLQQPGPPLVVRPVRVRRDEGDLGNRVGAPGHVLCHEQGDNAGRSRRVQENKLPVKRNKG